MASPNSFIVSNRAPPLRMHQVSPLLNYLRTRPYGEYLRLVAPR